MKEKHNYLIGGVLAIYAIGLAINTFIRDYDIYNMLVSFLVAIMVGGLSCYFFNKNSKKNIEKRQKQAILRQTSLTEETLAGIEEGKIPTVYADKLILNPDEICHYYTNATRLITKNRVVGYSGSSGGISVRVTKGISLKTGSHQGTPIRGDVTEETRGRLFITNKRIIFMSVKNSFEIKLEKIIATEYYSNGIGIQNDKDYYLMKLIAPEIPLSMIRVLIVQNQAFQNLKNE